MRLETWLEHDISSLDAGLRVIGRQVECLSQTGDVVVVELKRDKTPREITQILDYGSWVKDLSNERVTALAEGYLGRGKFEEAFKLRKP